MSDDSGAESAGTWATAVSIRAGALATADRALSVETDPRRLLCQAGRRPTLELGYYRFFRTFQVGVSQSGEDQQKRSDIGRDVSTLRPVERGNRRAKLLRT